MSRSLAALATLLALALPTVAAADPPWSAPQNLSSPHLFVDPVDVTTSGNNTTLAWWDWQDGVGTSARNGVSLASRAPGAATFGSERAAPGNTIDIAGYAQTRAIALTARGDRTRIAVAFGATSGTFGSQRTIASGTQLARPVLAVNPSGAAAVAYFQDRGVTNDRVMVSLRRAGGSFGKPFQIAHGRVRSVAVAVGERGDVLVAWDTSTVIQARYMSPGAKGFQPIETISSRATAGAEMEAAIAGVGRGYVAWSAQLRTEGGTTGPVFNEVAVRPSGHRFRAAQLLEQDPANLQQEPVVIATQGRDATVAWTGFDGANERVRVAATDPSARFGAPQDVSPAGRDSVASDIAIAGPTRVVVWDNGGFDANQVFASVAPFGSPFGPAEAVSPAQEARAGRVVIAPQPTIVWTNRPAGSHPPGGIAAIQTFAQAATRGS